MLVRNYKTEDYQQVISLYKQSELFGGQFDKNRDSEERLSRRIASDPESILVCETEGKIVGTVSLIEDGRVAWLFRFAVEKGKDEHAINALYDKALAILRVRGHKQVLVYAPANSKNFEKRYSALGFEKGNDYSCYWRDI